MKHISGCFCLKTANITDSSQSALSYEDTRLLIRLLGHLGGMYNDTELGPLLADRFLSFGEDITRHLSGVYQLLVYDKKMSLHIFHGMSTFPQVMYYATDQDCLYYSTSLKFILKHVGIRRRFDKNGLREFLLNGYVVGSKTLVEDVRKVEGKSVCSLPPWDCSRMPRWPLLGLRGCVNLR